MDSEITNGTINANDLKIKNFGCVDTLKIISRARHKALELYGWYKDVVIIPFQKNIHSNEETVMIAMQHKRKEFIYRKQREMEINKFFRNLKKYCIEHPRISCSFAQFGTTHCGTDTNAILISFYVDI